MSVFEYLRALGGIFAHRVRALLTILGIVIGTSSIVLLASLIDGGEGFLKQTNQEVSGSDIVEADVKTPPPNETNRTTRPLSRADGDAIAAAVPGAIVASESDRRVFADYAGQRRRVSLVSAGRTTMDLYRLKIAAGRALDEDDRGRRVCIVGEWVHRELLKSAPLTDTLSLSVNGRLFRVVGILAKKPVLGGSDPQWTWNGKVLIPEVTYDTIYSAGHEVDRIYARNAKRRTVTSVLFERHLGVSNFELAKDQSGGMEDLIMKVIHALLLSTGVLALLASGINIMNVMLVTVTERTREIGLRRAIGAPRRTILVQFLLEAATLSLVGSLIGVAVGIALAWLVAKGASAALGEWAFHVPLWSLALGVGLALVTGVSFGLLPAWRASRVSPIDALRSD